MTIHSVSPFAASTPSAASGTSNNNTTTTTGLGGTAPSEQMFLQLLVAQIKNQDPTNPADSTQFVTQLAQFSQLEQVIAIRQDTDSMKTAATAAATTTGSSSTTQVNKS